MGQWQAFRGLPYDREGYHLAGCKRFGQEALIFINKDDLEDRLCRLQDRLERLEAYIGDTEDIIAMVRRGDYPEVNLDVCIAYLEFLKKAADGIDNDIEVVSGQMEPEV